MKQESRRGAQDKIGGIVGFATGAAFAMTVFSLPVLDKTSVTIEKRSPVPPWVGFVLWPGLCVVALLIERLRRNPYVLIALFGTLPDGVFISLGRNFHAGPELARQLRGVGLLLSFLALFLTALWFSRQKRELERVVFMQASALAFFVMVTIGTVYGIASQFFGAPSISYTWLGLIGIGTWTASLIVMEARLS